MPPPASRFLELPNELLESIVTRLDLLSLASCQLTCKHLQVLTSNPLLWRRFCLHDYKHWELRHEFPRRAQAPASNTEWKELLTLRKNQDRRVEGLLNDILDTQTHRLARIGAIARFGYDAKDMLQSHMNARVDVGNGLARNYWCVEALGHIERIRALQEWKKLADGEDVPLERALVAFDLFAAERPPMTIEGISLHFDFLAESVRLAYPEFEHSSAREKADAVMEFCNGSNLGRLSEVDNFHNLQNSLISFALCDRNHPSLQIISAAIYCCIAQRLGLDAYLCNFPGHVLCMIYPPPGKTIEGRDSTESPRSQGAIFLDPFTQTSEITMQTLRSHLLRYGIHATDQQAQVLQPGSTIEIVQRVAQNILNISRASTAPVGNYFEVLKDIDATLLGITNTEAFRTTLNLHRAIYAARWVAVLFANAPPDPDHDPDTRRQALLAPLSHLLRQLSASFACDIRDFLPRYIEPLLTDPSHVEHGPLNLDDIRSAVAEQIASDAEVPRIHRRTEEPTRSKVKYRVGQVFVHHRFRYIGAIYGWDTRCEAESEWINHMGVDRLPGGREQCFYNVIADDETERYVAEENIELLGRGGDGNTNLDERYYWAARGPGARDGDWTPVQENPSAIEAGGLGPWIMPEALRHIAGRWFKRWDPVHGKFVSNVTTQYPDDEEDESLSAGRMEDGAGELTRAYGWLHSRS